MTTVLVDNGPTGIRYIKLNRPEKRNALSPELIENLNIALTEANDDETVRVVILAAVGQAFSAGADLVYLQQLQNNSYQENLEDSTKLKELFQLIYTHRKVIIAQVEGHAIAGGCGLATVCDMVYSVPGAQYGYTEVKIGFIPAIVMFYLLRKIGESRTRELLLTGKLIDANTAMQYGMINYICPANEITEIVLKQAIEIAQQTSPASIRMTRQMMADIQNMDAYSGPSFAAEQNALARGTEDCQRGIAAFLNKEKISWS
ncbi:MAG: enoyl-CoA hydratase-related protein [Bacteroidota bacterium]|nr:enoyl-CoA hydratase-related protein [Bacteroidota bacterium]